MGGGLGGDVTKGAPGRGCEVRERGGGSGRRGGLGSRDGAVRLGERRGNGEDGVAGGTLDDGADGVVGGLNAGATIGTQELDGQEQPSSCKGRDELRTERDDGGQVIIWGEKERVKVGKCGGEGGESERRFFYWGVNKR